MMGYDGYGWLGGMGGFGMLAGVLFMVALVVLLVWGAGALFDERGGSRETPLDILRRRYAAGEISQGEYEQARQTLGEGAASR